jgi:hypothetical protein
MAALTRRGFLTTVSMSVAAIGALVSVPGLEPALERVEAHEAETHGAEGAGHVVAFVPKGSREEITIMVGTRKVIVRDRRMVSRLLHAAR